MRANIGGAGTAPIREIKPTNNIAEIPQAEGNGALVENTRGVEYTTVWVFLGFIVLYFLYNYLQNRTKIKEAVEPKNIAANAHNLAVIFLAAVIGINIGRVIFTKFAAMRIPVISPIAGHLLPLIP